jgi:predicted RNA binding protein YcfA (HicA-like mRNA interferase family)
MKIKEIIKMIEDDGWYYSRQTGSHRQYKHDLKKGTVTVAGKLNDDLDRGTQKSILKQAGLNNFSLN